MALSGIVFGRAYGWEVDWTKLRRALESGEDIKSMKFQLGEVTLEEVLSSIDVEIPDDEDDRETYMKAEAAVAQLTWRHVVEEGLGDDPDRVNARLLRESISMGRESEVLALKFNGRSRFPGHLRVPCNILDAVLAQSSWELEAMMRGDDDDIEYCIEHRGRDLCHGYPTEPPHLLGCELVKLGMKPTHATDLLLQSNDQYLSCVRALYAHTAFQAGLISHLREVRVGQRELFLTDLPLHIVCAISADSEEREVKHFGSMVDSMMAHGLTTRFAIKDMVAAIQDNYEVDVLANELELDGPDAAATFRVQVQTARLRFLEKWRRKEIRFSRQRMSLVHRLCTQVGGRFMPASLLYHVDSFLLGDFKPVLDSEAGIDFELS